MARCDNYEPRSKLLGVLTDYPVTIGLVVRLFLACFLPWLLDNGGYIPGVRYTDIDFDVFSDAARHIQHGGSPFDRTTYRYTPFLAELLAILPTRESGRYLFCIADALCGWIILMLRRRRKKRTTAATFQDALWWLYNPLAINICTRGSAESLVVLLPVLLTVSIARRQRPSLLSALLAGACHGVAIHAKLYPIIYTLSFLTNFVQKPPLSTSNNKFGVRILLVWIRRLLSPAPLLFGVTTVVVFGSLTYLAYTIYGPVALHEGLLYHFSRVDHRHNYSMHWYWIYLCRANGISMTLVGRLLLLPQIVLLFYTSLGVAPHNLCLAIFAQTFLFVAHNKVITAQYFTWYLCLLPLASDSLRMTRRVVRALIFLVVSILFWLGSAYCLEMQGWSVHRIVWFASVVFFWANVNLLGALLESSSSALLNDGERTKRD